MSDTNTDGADVIQSRLAWEPGDITEVSVGELEPHPKNREVYGDTDDPSDLNENFVESVGEKGVLEPVVITNDKTLISGHRRWLAAKANDIDSIPARISEFENDLTEREAVIEFNRQRDKTPGQIVNEFEEILEIEQTRAQARKKSKRTDQQEMFPDGQNADSTGQAREKAAEKVGADVTGKTLEKGKKVKEKAESEDAPDSVKETAQQQWEQLESGKQSFNGAYEEVKSAEKDHVRQQRKGREKEAAEQSEQALTTSAERNSTFSIEQGDLIQLGEHQLYCGDSSSDAFREHAPDAPFAFADPPYNAGAAEWDHEFEWQHDWLNDTADVVAVTPGIGSIFDFAQRTAMPYLWSVACWIKNGRARGEMGYGNWVYVAMFSDESIHRNSQDIVTVTIKESEKDLSHHRGRKFPRLMTWLFERYCPVGKTVIDPFLGSGTTLLAAEEAGRECYAAEINPEFCGEIVARWEDTTGESAEVIDKWQ